MFASMITAAASNQTIARRLKSPAHNLGGGCNSLDDYTAKPYIEGVEIEFDPEKDAANLAKHGVSLVLGVVVLENCIGDRG